MRDPAAMHGAGQQSMRLSVGGVSFLLRSDRPFGEVGLSEASRYFVTRDAAQVRIDLHFGPLPAWDRGAVEWVFDSESLWRLGRRPAGDGSEWLCVIGDRPVYRLAVFSEDFLRGHIYSLPAGRSGRSGPGLPDPLAYPLGELLMIQLLSRGRGAMLHACGVDRGGRGLLCVGASGRGKTTLARLWAGRGCGRILNDDRIVVRFHDDVAHMYGTPWHGELDAVCAASVPVEGVVLIEHAPVNQLRPLPPAEAAFRLMADCFAPHWSRAGLESTLACIERLVDRVPCYHLGFVPDTNVLEILCNLRP